MKTALNDSQINKIYGKNSQTHKKSFYETALL